MQNRLTQDSSVHGLSSSVSYNYDIANRLTEVGGVPYVYDANGNASINSAHRLLNDGVNTYVYDSANRLESVTGPSSSTQYTYNGLGDRLTQNGVQYTLDLNAGLTQVLADGANTYLYGLGRIAERQGGTNEYYLGDALGSLRQLTNGYGEVTLTRSYDPYGKTSQSIGFAQTDYGFTGEFTDSTGLVYLRSRHYSPEIGRFLSRDTWNGNLNNPETLNRYAYANNNPILYTDPSGHFAQIIAGVALGAAIGYIGGLAFAGLTYGWAIQGKCGCEMQQWALGAGPGWVDKAAGYSALIGAVAGAVASTGPVGIVIVGAFGVTTSAVDALRTSYQVMAQGGFDNCTLLRFVTDVVGYVGSVAAISAGGNTLIDNGYPSFDPYSPWASRVSYPDGGIEKGMMTEMQFEYVRAMAMKRGAFIDIAGGYAETELGLYNRANNDPSVPSWRAKRMPTWAEIDTSKVSNLSPAEQAQLKEVFGVNTIDTEGYGAKYYGQNQPDGSIRFNPDGTTNRFLGSWQQK